MPRAAGSRAPGARRRPPAPRAARLLALVAALVVAVAAGGARAQRPRSDLERKIINQYTLAKTDVDGGGWVDPTPGGCEYPQGNPKGNTCGPWRGEPIPWSKGKQKYAMKQAKKQKVMKKWNLPDDGSWYESKVRSAEGFTKIPGRGRPEMKWYRDSYAVYHPELDRYVCHCMSNGKPGCTFLDPETGSYVKDAATWSGLGGSGSGENMRPRREERRTD